MVYIPLPEVIKLLYGSKNDPGYKIWHENIFNFNVEKIKE
jgi:hypothetical protein